MERIRVAQTNLQLYNQLRAKGLALDDPVLIATATELGERQLAEMLSSAFSETAAMRAVVPAELRPSDGRSQLKLIVPRPCRRSIAVTLHEA